MLYNKIEVCWVLVKFLREAFDLSLKIRNVKFEDELNIKSFSNFISPTKINTLTLRGVSVFLFGNKSG